MSKHRPRSFNADGTPKGKSATPAGESRGVHIARGVDDAPPRRPAATNRNAGHVRDRAAGIPAHDLKPSDTPITPDVDTFHAKRTGPQSPPPVRHPPTTGKLKSRGVESHARYAPIANTGLFDDSLTRFSESTTLMIAALAALVGIMGLLALVSFSGTLAILVLAGVVIAGGVVLSAFMMDYLPGYVALMLIAGLLAAGVVGMWLLAVEDDDPRPANSPPAARGVDGVDPNDPYGVDPYGYYGDPVAD